MLGKKLIIIDGPNGAGKTSIITQLTRCDKVFAPGYTELGAILRPLCRGTSNIKIHSRAALTHLFVSDRLETLYTIIRKSPEKVIVTDRWLISTIAYQAILNNCDFHISQDILDIILKSVKEKESEMIHTNMFYIECDNKEKIKRITQEREKNKDHLLDNFIVSSVKEQEDLSFKFKTAFEIVSSEFSKKTIKLLNNSESDFTECVNTIQSEIDQI